MQLTPGVHFNNLLWQSRNAQVLALSFQTPCVNFINILNAPFLYEIKFCSFLQLRFSFVIFGTKISCKKMNTYNVDKIDAYTQSSLFLEGQSYQTLFFFIFLFLLLSLSVCFTWKKCIECKITLLNNKKWKICVNGKKFDSRKRDHSLLYKQQWDVSLYRQPSVILVQTLEMNKNFYFQEIDGT